MVDFILRYLGILVAGFCIGYGRRFDFTAAMLSLVATLAIMISCLYYHNKGTHGEDL